MIVNKDQLNRELGKNPVSSDGLTQSSTIGSHKTQHVSIPQLRRRLGSISEVSLAKVTTCTDANGFVGVTVLGGSWSSSGADLTLDGDEIDAVDMMPHYSRKEDPGLLFAIDNNIGNVDYVFLPMLVFNLYKDPYTDGSTLAPTQDNPAADACS